MAPKRSAPPPPPPPPAASSEETDSGSGSEEEEEEEEEEEIAHSPPPAALKSTAPPQHKDKESESESESSDEDEDGEEEEDGDEEEEEDEKANRVVPSSATKNPPPPQPPTREESESSDEEEEADEEVPQAKPAPKQSGEVKGAKRQGNPFQRIWSTDDEFRILEVLAAHRLKHGTLPQTEVLADAIAGKLDNSGSTLDDLKNKVRKMRTRHTKLVKRGVPPSKDQDCRLFDLANNVWPSGTKAATKVAVAANGGAGREPADRCELYPYLAEEVKVVQKAHQGMFKREFEMIDDSKAHALDEKIKKQRREQMKLHVRYLDMIKESTKALMDLAR